MKAHFLAEARLLKQVAGRPFVTFAFSDHAEDEMRKDGITRVDIVNIAQAGSVAGIEFVRDHWRLRVMGSEGDGGLVTFIAVVDDGASRIDVVTAWKRRGRR